MSFQETFAAIKQQFINTDVSKLDSPFAIQINLTGKDAGTFYVEAKDGKLSIEPYEYQDRDVLVTISSTNLLKIAGGKLDPVMAFTFGKLKAEGNIGKALELKKLLKK